MAIAATAHTEPSYFIEVIGIGPDRRPAPLTTQARIIVVAWSGPICVTDTPPAVVTGRTITFKFVMGGICVTTPTGWATSIDLGYLPAGTYTGVRNVVSPDGSVVETETLTFDVLEAGTPPQIPALNTVSLVFLALALASAGLLASH